MDRHITHNMCIHIYMGYTYAAIRPSIHPSIKNHDFLLVPSLSVQYHRTLSGICPFCITQSPSVENLASSILNIPTCSILKKMLFRISHLWKVNVLVSQLCPTLFDPVDTRFLCPGNSSGERTRFGCHSLLRRPFWPRDQTQVFCIAGRFFNVWATREA